MKTKYWVILITFLLILCTGLSMLWMLPGEAARQAEVWSQGLLWGTVDLQQDQEFTVPTPEGGSNTVTVSGGKIAVTAATCPDHYCMHRGFCSSGADIVCLPNRLVIVFLTESEVDAVIG